MRGRSLFIALALSAIVFGLAGCATGGASPRGGSEPALTLVGARVSILSAGFVPGTVNIKVGESVTWMNEDHTAHNVAGAGLVSGEIAPGKSYSHTFDTPGTYNYICTLHPSTAGLVIVTPK